MLHPGDNAAFRCNRQPRIEAVVSLSEFFTMTR
jgi:hypothetical protein